MINSGRLNQLSAVDTWLLNPSAVLGPGKRASRQVFLQLRQAIQPEMAESVLHSEDPRVLPSNLSHGSQRHVLVLGGLKRGLQV